MLSMESSLTDLSFKHMAFKLELALQDFDPRSQ